VRSNPVQTATAPVSAVVFDLDGTLIDSCADIASAANHCLAVGGLPTRSQREICSFIGDGSRVLLQRASGLAPQDPRLDEMLLVFVGHYTEHAVVQTQLLPGVREVLEALSDLPRAVCTNKPRVTTQVVLERLGIAPLFDVVVAGGDTERHKPHPAPLLRVAEQLGLDVADLVLVGDGPQDVECARAAGARSIGIREAIIVPLEKLRAAGPDRLVPLAEVPEVIREWRTAK
jgi:2-phosphoglycolate phosphatase